MSQQEDINTISPTTGEIVTHKVGDTVEQLLEKAKISTAAFGSFQRTTLSDRKDYVGKALSWLLEHQDELADSLTKEMGRPRAYTAGEVTTAVKRANYLLGVSDAALTSTEGEPEKGFRRFIEKVPVGPVLVIFPWNYPYLTLVNSLVPALLAGNTVIIKPSPQTPSVAGYVAKAFASAGLPENVLQVVHCGSPKTLESLVRDPQIKHICFTGSLEGGLAVQKKASERIVDVGLELGGNDPAYVRNDVDVAWAAEEIVDGAIFNSGQSCCAIERVYVHKDVYDDFLKAVQRVLSQYRVGEPSDLQTQIGPVISKAAQARIQAQIEDAIKAGAEDATPSNPSFQNLDEKFPGGSFVRPTLLVNVNHDMVVMKEETFGPVIPVMKVSGDDEAVELMNDSDLGLTASIWSKDEQGAYALSRRVEAGTVFVNRADYPSPDLAWTGWKNSGKGVTLSKYGFDQFVKLKSYH